MKTSDIWNEDIAIFSVDWFDFDGDKLETYLFVSEEFESCLSDVRDYFDVDNPSSKFHGEIRGIKMIGWGIERSITQRSRAIAPDRPADFCT